MEGEGEDCLGSGKMKVWSSIESTPRRRRARSLLRKNFFDFATRRCRPLGWRCVHC